MHTIRFRLKTTPYDVYELDRRFRYVWHIHNQIVKHSVKLIEDLRKDEIYRQLLDEYNKENISDEEKKSVSKKLTEVRERYHLTEANLQSYAKVMQRNGKHLVTSQQVQVEASRVYDGVCKVLFSDGKKLNYKKLNQFHSIGGKQATNGVRINERYHNSLPASVKPVFEDEIEFLGLHIAIDIDYEDPYVIQSLNNKLKYCNIVRMIFPDGWHYYVDLVLDGVAPKRHPYKEAVQGMDPGVSTIAVVSDEAVMLEELAPCAKNYDKLIAKLQRKIDASKRQYNPENYNPDGTIKKGHHKWILSKTCKKNMLLLRVIRRKQSASTKQSHEELANRVIENGNVIYVEAMNYKALAKRSRKKTEKQNKVSKITTKKGETRHVRKNKRKRRYGSSIRARSPGMFNVILDRKAKQCGGHVFKIDTKTFRASQYRHDTDSYEKVSLSCREKEIAGYKVQRDLYSAFLIRNTDSTMEHADRKKCLAKFDDFVRHQNEYITAMKDNGITYKACFGF